MTLKKLVLLTVLDVFLVLVISFIVLVVQAAATSQNATWGTLRALQAVGVPLHKLGLQERLDQALTWGFRVAALCTALPENDAALAEWLKQHSDLAEVRIERHKLKEPRSQGETEHVWVRYSGPSDTRRLDVPWAQLGYELGQPRPSTWFFRSSPETRYTPSDPQLKLIVIACLIAGMFFVGIFRMWQNRQKDLVPQSNDAPGLLVGLGVGLLLSALYWVYHQVALLWGGPKVVLDACWQALPISGVDMVRSGLPVYYKGVEPHVFLLAVFGLVTFLYPLGQLVFVWGVFRRWTYAGWVKTGCVLASAITASLLFSWWYFPATFLWCACLYWLGHRTQSMGPSLVALIVLCAAVIGVVFGAIPSYAHPINQLPGKWQRKTMQNKENEPRVEAAPIKELRFLHGGGASGERITDRIGSFNVVLAAWHYDWVSDDTIRLIWSRDAYDFGTTTYTSDWLREDFRVAITWEDLTLTRVSDGVEWKFFRAD